MTIIELAKRSGAVRLRVTRTTDPEEFYLPCNAAIERFAALVADAERNKAIQWLRDHGYTTGHGDTIEDLMRELEWQVADACAKVCTDRAVEWDSHAEQCGENWNVKTDCQMSAAAHRYDAAAIRAKFKGK